MMGKLRRIKGIGMIDEWGNVVEKCPYEGAKGFKILKRKNHNIVYSLETQEKLFSLAKNVPIMMNDKALVIPILSIIHLLNRKDFEFFDLENLLGVFNTSGEMWKLARRVKFEKEFIQISFCESGDKMGLYTYDGEEIFCQAYYFIECIEVNLFGKKQTLFYTASSEKGTRALFGPDKRLIFGWKFYDIVVNPKTNKVTLSYWKEPKKEVYQLLQAGESVVTQKIKESVLRVTYL